jgi:apolipoprotein N-acyltransferase
MCLPWLGFRITKKWLGENFGYASLLAFWMCFEYIHLQDWGLSWPWLTLGNSFATHTEWVQWYEYTGTSGGSLWILLVNIFLYLHLKRNTERIGTKTYRYLGFAVAFLMLPILISRFGFKPIKPTASDSNIVVVQPNIDPYEKISVGTFDAQINKLISTSETQIDRNTALVIWPETALYTENRIDENGLKQNYFLNPLWAFLKKYPDISLFTGIESYRLFDKPTKYSEHYNGYNYESYNGSALLDSSGASGFYHKSMLVPGVETLPWFLRFLSSWFEKFGGTTAGYARQDKRTILTDKHGFKIAPAICYESIYGEYMSQYVRNGANLICVITNDGWWKKTPGHKQHMNYARLRAIETRTWVARSANTGISCFIDPNGTVINARPYDTVAAIKLNIMPNETKTFYVKYGDLLSKIMVLLSGLSIIAVVVLKIKLKFGKRPPIPA